MFTENSGTTWFGARGGQDFQGPKWNSEFKITAKT